MFQPPPSSPLVSKMPEKLWSAASMEAAAAANGGSAIAPSAYQSNLCYPGISNSFIQPHQYHHPKASEDRWDQQNYYQNWSSTAAAVTSPAAATASPIHVNYIMNSNVIHNYHAPQHYSYPPQSFQVCS